MAVDIVELDGDLTVSYRIGTKEFKCFPSDELDLIHDAVEKVTGPGKIDTLKGTAFLSIIQQRLKTIHGAEVSMSTASKWYDSLHQKLTEHKNFTGGSGDTVEPMATGHSTDLSQNTKSKSSKSSSKASGPKNTSSISAICEKTQKSVTAIS